MNAEEWRPIPEWPGYDVSDLGRVRSHLQRGVRVRKARLNSNGYLSVELWRGVRGARARTNMRVHVLVARAFIGPRPEGLQIRHLNGDRTDARLVNLTYGTASENAQDSLSHGTHPEARKTQCVHGHDLAASNLYASSVRVERVCATCRRAYMRLYRATTRSERLERSTAGLPVVDLDAHFAKPDRQERAA